MWIVEHFRILPTDQRFKDLTKEQMEFLYLNFLEAPDENVIKKAYIKTYIKEERKIDDSDLKDLGYDKEGMEEINKALEDLDIII